MKVQSLGEFGLIQRLADRIARDERQRNARLVIGIGDDAAAWRPDDAIELLTTDTLMQDVHFRLGVGTWRDLGWKALAVNVSDIAAMGGVPRYAVVTLGLPADTDVSAMDELYEGMLDMA
ncbi:MAG: AIR synthase related protein, partial [Dehalococcoidia bacterium]|nr:AIR synthase related protein [Dehalococcoidia bacterium]